MTLAGRPERRVLGLFARQPSPGQAKTRLAAATSSEFAARVAAAFLDDTLDRLASIHARRLLALAPVGDESSRSGLGNEHFEVVSQGPGNLGERLERFIRGQLAQGADAVVVVGSDSPTLPPSFVEQAFAELERADVVLGPAMDGGYYLVGCRCLPPSLFSCIDWGGEHVLWQTVERLEGEAGKLAVLPPWYDVDVLADWQVLRGHLAALRRAGIDPGVPRTEALMQEFVAAS